MKDMDKDTLVLHAARASRTENQDAIDGSIVEMLGDPTEVCSSISSYALLVLVSSFSLHFF